MRYKNLKYVTTIVVSNLPFSYALSISSQVLLFLYATSPILSSFILNYLHHIFRQLCLIVIIHLLCIISFLKYVMEKIEYPNHHMIS